jgi:hypothetical protein
LLGNSYVAARPSSGESFLFSLTPSKRTPKPCI